MRSVLKGVTIVVLALLAVVLLALGALRLEPVRTKLREELLSLVQSELRGKLEAQDLRLLSVREIELTGVVLRDQRGNRVGTVKWVSIRFDPLALLSGVVRIKAARIEGFDLELGRIDTQQGGLFDALPAASDENEKSIIADKKSFPSAIVVERVCVNQARLTARLGEGRALLFDKASTCGRFKIELGNHISIKIGVEKLIGKLSNGGRSVARFSTQADLGTHPSDSDPLAAAALYGELQLGSDKKALDARLLVRGLSRATLSTLGVEAEWIKTPTDLEITAKGPFSDLDYRIELGHASEPGPDPLAARIEGRLMWPKGVDTLELVSEIRDARYDAIELPKIKLTIRVPGDGSIRVEDLRMNQASARLRGQASLAADGTIHANATVLAPNLEALPVLKALAPEISAALRAELKVERNTNERWSAAIEANLSKLKVSTNRIRRVKARMRMEATESAPKLHASIEASGLQIEGRQISQARLRVDGGPDRYALSGSAENGFISLSGWVANREGFWEGAGGFELRTSYGPISARVARLRFEPQRALRVRALSMRYDDVRAQIDGKIGLGGSRSSLTVVAQVPRLRGLTRRFTQLEVPGRLRVKGQATGQLVQPVLQLEVDYDGGVRFDDKPVSAKLQANADFQQGSLRADLVLKQARLARNGPSSRVDLNLVSRFHPGPIEVKRLERAEYEIRLAAEQVSLPVLLSFLPPDAVPFVQSVEGSVSARLKASGTLTEPRAAMQLDSRVRFQGDSAPVLIKVKSDYQNSELVTSLTVDDRIGRLLNARAENVVGKDLLTRGFASIDQVLMQSRWKLALDLARRRVWNLPKVRSVGNEKDLFPWQVALNAKLSHVPGAEPQGELNGRVEWLPAAVVANQKADRNCASRTPVSTDIAVQISEGRLVADLRSQIDGREVLSLRGSSTAPLNRWHSIKRMMIGPAQLDARIKQLRVEDVPFLCKHAKGVVSANLQASDLFTERANFRLEAKAADFRWAQGPLFNAYLRARPVGNMLDIDLQANLAGRDGRTRITGKLPISIRVDRPALSVSQRGPVDLQAVFSSMEVQPLLAMAPGVGNSSGRVAGSLKISGSLTQPKAKGSLKLSDVSFTLPEIGQRFSRINGTVMIDGRRLRLPRIRFEDREGWAKVAAEVTLISPRTWSAELDLETNDFPLRNQGIYHGTVDTRTHVSASANPKRMKVDAEIEELSVQLTTQKLEGIQSLEKNPDIVFVHPEDQKDELEETSSREIVIRIRSKKPVWIRRDDFALKIKPNLIIRPQARAARVEGKIEIERGFIKLFGKSLKVERGRISFTGADQLNPELEITATHDNPGGGKTRVEVSGLVRSPTLEFFMNDQPATAPDALAAITGSASSGALTDREGSAQAQLTSVALGTTMGLLSLGARRELGEWVPIFSMDQAKDDTRINAGIEADRIVPEFLSDVVRGAYVEGIVSTGSGTEQNSASSNGASGGVLLELLLPFDFVWAGQYGPGQRWSIDFDWRP